MIKGGVVVGNLIKKVNQLDVMVHNVSIVETMTFGACLDLNR
jgi:hypothetical protein